MPDIVKFPLVLLLVAGISGGLLSLVFDQTQEKIEEAKMRKVYAAFEEIARQINEPSAKTGKTGTIAFTDPKKQSEKIELDLAKIEQAKQYYFFEKGTAYYYALKDDTGTVFAHAVQVKGVGYNKTKPIEMIVGVTTDAAKVLRVVVTFSEETPGLGEKIRAAKPKNTWVGIIRGDRDDTGDLSPDFLQKFMGRDEKNCAEVDGISGATISSDAVKDAVAKAVADLKILTGK